MDTSLIGVVSDNISQHPVIFILLLFVFTSDLFFFFGELSQKILVKHVLILFAQYFLGMVFESHKKVTFFMEMKGYFFTCKLLNLHILRQFRRKIQRIPPRVYFLLALYRVQRVYFVCDLDNAARLFFRFVFVELPLDLGLDITDSFYGYLF